MLSDSLNKALNQQINHELKAAYSYLAMAAWFDARSLKGFASWMKQQASEEVTHANKIYDHVQDTEGKIELLDIAAPKIEFGSVLELLRGALELEQNNTAAINKLYKLAVDEGHYPTQIMLHWFISEQVEEESTVQELIDQLSLAGESGNSLLILNGRMAQRSS